MVYGACLRYLLRVRKGLVGSEKPEMKGDLLVGDIEEAIIWASSVGKAVDCGMPTNEGTKGRFISVLRPRH
ncbi:hypothetical protein M0802_004388 [Mischocyttarus mexicanus]|nr:hypothetical protein M0802_004388 [Mischocyttarus mexicanus]